jgi:hypothetical protein
MLSTIRKLIIIFLFDKSKVHNVRKEKQKEINSMLTKAAGKKMLVESYSIAEIDWHKKELMVRVDGRKQDSGIMVYAFIYFDFKIGYVKEVERW